MRFTEVRWFVQVLIELGLGPLSLIVSYLFFLLSYKEDVDVVYLLSYNHSFRKYFKIFSNKADRSS